jgi:hypothetical protein
VEVLLIGHRVQKWIAQIELVATKELLLGHRVQPSAEAMACLDLCRKQPSTQRHP